MKLYSITRSGQLPLFHPVVADLRHHHSLELEQIEAPIAHAIYFRFSPSPYHLTVKELEAILMKVQENLAVQEAQEVPEVHMVQEEHQDHRRR